MAPPLTAESLKLRTLSVGEDLLVSPDEGETVDQALNRWRRRLSRQRDKTVSFRSRIDGAQIRIQKTAAGRNRKTADLIMMEAGTYLLLKTKPTPSDVKKAQNLASYATGKIKGPLNKNGKPESCCWLPAKDRQGRLLIVCVCDANGRCDDKAQEVAPPGAVITTRWEGEWL